MTDTAAPDVIVPVGLPDRSIADDITEALRLAVTLKVFVEHGAPAIRERLDGMFAAEIAAQRAESAAAAKAAGKPDKSHKIKSDARVGLGSFTLAEPRPDWRVADLAEFIRWARPRFPDVIPVRREATLADPVAVAEIRDALADPTSDDLWATLVARLIAAVKVEDVVYFGQGDALKLVKALAKAGRLEHDDDGRVWLLPEVDEHTGEILVDREPVEGIRYGLTSQAAAAQIRITPDPEFRDRMTLDLDRYLGQVFGDPPPLPDTADDTEGDG